MSISWSYSSYSLALQCLACWHKKYVLQEPEKGGVSADLAFGTAMHSAVNDAITGGNGTDVFRIFWDSYKNTPMEYTRFKYHELDDIGHKLIARFVTKYAPRMKPLVAEQRLYGEFNGVKLEGQMDFYGEFDGALSLLDWKTAAYAYDKSREKTALQPRLYTFLAIANGHEPPSQEGYFVFNKGACTIQTPLLWNYDESVTKKMLTEMTEYCRMFESMKAFPRNPNCPKHIYNCYASQ